MHRRMAMMNGGYKMETWPEDLILIDGREWFHEDQMIEAIREAAGDVIIIDTLALFLSRAGVDVKYQAQYKAIARMEREAQDNHVALIATMHNRKNAHELSTSDFDEVSGSVGITGAADSILVMKMEKGVATLSTTSRDFEGDKYNITFNKEYGIWHLDTSPVKRIEGTREYLYEIIASAGSRGVIFEQIKDAFGRKSKKTLADESLRQSLRRMKNDGLIVCTVDGHYRERTALLEGLRAEKLSPKMNSQFATPFETTEEEEQDGKD
jgi:hypothetical protein